MAATPKPKKDLSGFSSFIERGEGEIAQQSPAQRGIKVTAPVLKRMRFTVNLTPSVIEWARRCVVFTPGQSLAGLVEDALLRELERLEKKRGEPFPETTATPKKGRPITLGK